MCVEYQDNSFDSLTILREINSEIQCYNDFTGEIG
jgi:hypothetical protein